MQNILVTLIILGLARPSWTGPENYLYCRLCSESQECDDGTVEKGACIMDQRESSSDTTYPPLLLSEYVCGASPKKMGFFGVSELLAAYHGAYCVTIVWKNGGEEQTTRGCRRATFEGQDICAQVEKACKKRNRELISCDTCQGPGKYCNSLPSNITRGTNTSHPSIIRTTKPPKVKGPGIVKCYTCVAGQYCDDPSNPKLSPRTCTMALNVSIGTIKYGSSLFENYTFQSRSQHPACGFKDTEPDSLYGFACVTLIAKVGGESYTSRFCQKKYENDKEICTHMTDVCNKQFDTEVVSCKPCYTDLCNDDITGPPRRTDPPKPETTRSTTPIPETSRPTTPIPETSRPTTPPPATPRPNTPRPETPRPETSRPETERPETFRPEFPKPDTTTPDMYRPDLPMPSDQTLRCYSCSGSTACANQINDPFTPHCQSSIVYDARTYNQSVERFSYFDDDPACGFTRFIQGEGPPVCFTFITNVRGIFFTNRGCARLEARGTYICMYIEQICGVKYVSCSTCRTPLCNTFGLAKSDEGTWKFGFSFISYIFVIVIIFSC